MNFLSHYYFERDNPDDNMVLGVVLPDLIKNAQKKNLYPDKFPEAFLDDERQMAILKGWERHLEADRIFHSSEFFTFYTNELKLLTAAACKGSVVKPFFLAHIGLELMLDHLLVSEGMVTPERFYEHLESADREALDIFLLRSGLDSTAPFFSFFDSFISSRYLLSYRKLENITYALNRICMRLWPNPFTDRQQEMLTQKLEEFRAFICKDYFSIFKIMEKQMR
ncbi:hypothetical protein [Pedobacter deserti]|uniref:hypothetical protein n=1 Tax=Pedobacter deserti TaxID=2817382 RepID=UPI00210B8C86|nr:hypothetical protein [Pedobacter sp. SYSU D00382]